jgi:hypothetical protein
VPSGKDARPSRDSILVRGGALIYEDFRADAQRYFDRYRTGYAISTFTFPGLNASQIVLRLREEGRIQFSYTRIRACRAANVRKAGFKLVQSAYGHVRIAFQAEPSPAVHANLIEAFGPVRPDLVDAELEEQP